MIPFETFEKVDIRIGTVVAVTDLPNAHKPAYLMEIDFGLLGIKKTSAQITDLYTKETILGKQLIAIVNFPKKQIGKIQSECLVLGSISKKGVIILTSSNKIKNGNKIQ